MNKNSIKSLPALLMFGLIVLHTSCYKDNKETMYPSPTICDTSNVTFSKDIMPIVSNSCAKSGCHDNSSSAGSLTSFNDVKAIALDGRFVAYINSGYMPKGASKLDACTINKITAWVNAGALNN